MAGQVVPRERSAVLQQTTPQQTASFPQFSNLCAELRLKIWNEFMLAEQRVVPIYIWDCGIRANPNLVSALLSTCAESRREALKFYDTVVPISRVTPVYRNLSLGSDPRNHGNLWGFLYLNLDHDMVLRNIDTCERLKDAESDHHPKVPLHSLQQRQIPCTCANGVDNHCPCNLGIEYPVGVLQTAHFSKIKKLCEKRHPDQEMIRAGVHLEDLHQAGCLTVHHNHVHDLFPNLTSYHEIVDTPDGRYNGKDGDLRLLDDLCTPGLGYFGRNRDRLQRDRPLVCATYARHVTDDWTTDFTFDELEDNRMYWGSFELIKERPLCVVKAPRKMARIGLKMFRRSDLRWMVRKHYANPYCISEDEGESVYSEDDESSEEAQEAHHGGSDEAQEAQHGDSDNDDSESDSDSDSDSDS